MTIWIPKGEFPSIQEDYTKLHGDWKGNILAYRTEIRQQGVMHLQNLYRHMWLYLTEENWVSNEADKDIEVYYMEHRDNAGEREEIKIWWRLWHYLGLGPGGWVGPHPFLKYNLHIDFLCYKVRRIEMVHQGRKIKPFVGDVTIYLTAVLEIDYNDWFDKGGIMEIVQEYFIRRIYKRNIREHEMELRRLANRYSDDFKHFIGMLRYKEDRQLMHPTKGFY
ncbi:MAG: hypothetical protein KKF44_05080 [Nanoarchaeota archaeon]|nr:hypothetical protein [Nanoarchaeota archaeon]